MTTTTKTTCHDPAHWESGSICHALAVMLQALEERTRDDRSTYWTLREGLEPEEREELQEILQAAHRGELPNDWRYETVQELLYQLLEHTDWPRDLSSGDELIDVLPEIADGLTYYATSDLFTWLAFHDGRAEFEEETELGSDHLNLADMARARMQEEIQQMGHILIQEALERL